MPGILNHFSQDETATLLADPQVRLLAQAGAWQELLAYLVEPTSTKPRPTITRGEMLRGLLPAVMRLPSRPEIEQRQWDRILGIVQATDTVTLADPGVQMAVALGVASGLLTQAEADVILLRPASRIEGLLGRAIGYVTADDLRAALGWPEPAPIPDVPAAV